MVLVPKISSCDPIVLMDLIRRRWKRSTKSLDAEGSIVVSIFLIAICKSEFIFDVKVEDFVM
jgi:hypothetical protein